MIEVVADPFGRDQCDLKIIRETLRNIVKIMHHALDTNTNESSTTHYKRMQARGLYIDIAKSHHERHRIFDLVGCLDQNNRQADCHAAVVSGAAERV